MDSQIEKGLCQHLASYTRAVAVPIFRSHFACCRKLALLLVVAFGCLTTPPLAAQVDHELIVGNGAAFGGAAESVVVSSEQVASMARENSPAGNLLHRESQALAVSNISHRSSDRDSICMAIRFLQLQEEHQRQKSAADALKLHFGLVASLALFPNLEAINSKLSEQEVALAAAEAQGIPVDTARFQIRQTQIELEAQRIRWHNSTAQLRSGLSSITASTIDTNYEPSETLVVQFRHHDADRLVSHALLHRKDLLALEGLQSEMTVSSLPMTRRLLSSVAPLIGNAPTPNNSIAAVPVWLQLLGKGKESQQREHKQRCQQLNEAIAAKRHEIESEVRRNTLRCIESYQLATLAQQTNQLWSDRVSALNRHSEIAGGKSELLWEAELKLISSSSEYFQRLGEARQAELELAESCGAVTEWPKLLGYR